MCVCVCFFVYALNIPLMASFLQQLLLPPLLGSANQLTTRHWLFSALSTHGNIGLPALGLRIRPVRLFVRVCFYPLFVFSSHSKRHFRMFVLVVTTLVCVWVCMVVLVCVQAARVRVSARGSSFAKHLNCKFPFDMQWSVSSEAIQSYKHKLRTTRRYIHTYACLCSDYVFANEVLEKHIWHGETFLFPWKSTNKN